MLRGSLRVLLDESSNRFTASCTQISFLVTFTSTFTSELVGGHRLVTERCVMPIQSHGTCKTHASVNKQLRVEKCVAHLECRAYEWQPQ